MILSALKCRINDTNRPDTVKTYEELEKMLKELDKRTRGYRDHRGAYDEDEPASIIRAAESDDDKIIVNSPIRQKCDDDKYSPGYIFVNSYYSSPSDLNKSP